MNRWPAAAAGLLLSALALCGCRDDGPQSYTMPADVSPEPLDQYLGVITSAQDASVDQDYLRVIEIEELVAQCMKELGFEYYPYLSGSIFDLSEPPPGPPRGSLEYAQQYGFGIVDQGPQREPSKSNEGTDPNAEYSASLSSSDYAPTSLPCTGTLKVGSIRRRTMVMVPLMPNRRGTNEDVTGGRPIRTIRGLHGD